MKGFRMDNLKHFDICIGLILAHLAKNFPTKIILRVDEIVALKDKSFESVDAEFVCECIEFLYDEGFIVYYEKHEANGGLYSFARLSLKGLVALKAEPKTLKEGESIGDKLKEGLTSMSFDALGDIASGLLVNWVTKGLM